MALAKCLDEYTNNMLPDLFQVCNCPFAYASVVCLHCVYNISALGWRTSRKREGANNGKWCTREGKRTWPVESMYTFRNLQLNDCTVYKVQYVAKSDQFCGSSIQFLYSLHAAKRKITIQLQELVFLFHGGMILHCPQIVSSYLFWRSYCVYAIQYIKNIRTILFAV